METTTNEAQSQLQGSCTLPHERMETILDAITDGVFTLDDQWCFTYVNRRAQELLQHSRDALLGFNVWEKFPQATGSFIRSEFERSVAQNLPVSVEAFYEPFQIWLAVRAIPATQGLTVYLSDTSTWRTAEQNLREERETLTAVINSTTDAVISTDSDGNIRIFNPSAERVFRRSSEGVLGQNVQMLMPARYQEAHPQHQRRFALGHEPSRMMGLGRVKGLRSDGQELDLEVVISQVRVNQQPMMIASLRDITERLRTDAERQQSRTQLIELNQKLMTQEKMLVKRIAQALHDQLGQTMAAIRMLHETITVLQQDKASSKIKLLDQQLGTLIGQSIRQVRQVLIDLHPPLLDELGLAAAIDNELHNRSTTQPQVRIVLDVGPTVAAIRWPTEVEYTAFMIAREGVENALRHSGASQVNVLLSGGALSLQLEVIDNGQGFTSTGASPPGHLGIAGMHQRAEQIGATVTLTSGDGSGTRLSLSWQPAL